MKNFSIIDGHALLGREHHLHLEADELLRRMDAHDIEMAIARPMGAELVVLNREGNDRVLRAHARIKAMVSVNPWFGNQAIEELKRCYDLGAVGLFLHPSRQGFFPTDNEARPLLDWAQEIGWPVIIHTGTFVYSDILALGEVAREYSGLNFIAGWGGFTDMWFELPGVFSEVSNLYLDASMIWSAGIFQIAREQGAGRILFGGAEPRNRYQTALNGIARIELTDEEKRAIMGDNARRLFKLS